MLPKLADGTSNKVWIVPSELGKAVEGISSAFTKSNGLPGPDSGALVQPPATPEVEEGEAAALPPARSGQSPADRPAVRRNPADVLFKRDE
jgi:hypothetical protein